MYVVTRVCDYMITLQKVIASASFTSLLALRKQAAILGNFHMTRPQANTQQENGALCPTITKNWILTTVEA